MLTCCATPAAISAGRQRPPCRCRWSRRAYTSALKYLVTGTTTEDSSERRHELIFELELLRAECEFLTGARAAADETLKGLFSRAANTVERASMHIDLCTTIAESSHAIAVVLGSEFPCPRCLLGGES
jgi:hypothetical protein